MLLPALADPTDAEAIRFGDRALTYRELAGVAAGIAERLDTARVAVWATPTLGTCAAVIGALVAWVALDCRMQRRILAELEAQGVSRRSALVRESAGQTATEDA